MRRFCSRCGESLVEAEVVKRPWWKKLLPSRGPKVVAVAPGQRTAAGKRLDIGLTLRKIFRRVRLVAGVLIIVGGIAYGAIPSLRHAVNSRVDPIKARVVQDVHPTYVPVHATGVTASTFIADHKGKLAVDEFTNTYWLARWNPDKEPMLTLNFGHKVTLKKMIFYSGVAADYVAYGRPSVLHLVYSNGQSDTLTPDDTDKPQTLSLAHASDITSVEIQIAGVYPGNGAPNVAITEIELFALHL